jgi:hypothetical protein
VAGEISGVALIIGNICQRRKSFESLRRGNENGSNGQSWQAYHWLKAGQPDYSPHQQLALSGCAKKLAAKTGMAAAAAAGSGVIWRS